MCTYCTNLRGWGEAELRVASFILVLFLSACSPRATPATTMSLEETHLEMSATQVSSTTIETPFIEPSDTPMLTHALHASSTIKPTVTPQLITTVIPSDIVHPTLTFTPTPAVLSEEGAKRVKPEDVLAEIIVPGGAGGGSTCYEYDLPTPHLELMRQPGIWDFELLMQAEILSCGWQAGERVSIWVYYPDGRKKEYEDIAIPRLDNAFAGFNFRFMPTLDDPAGDYQFYFYGSSGEASMTINFAKPEGAHIYWLGDGRLFLYQFAPHEIVRLLVYDSANFKSWQEIQVNDRGSLEIKTTYLYVSLVAIGKESGESKLVSLVPDYINHSIVYHRWPMECSIILHPCPEGLDQRVTCNTPPHVCEGVATLAVFGEPSLSASQIGALATGEDVVVIGGPVCKDQMSWWKVDIMVDQDYATGWVSEGNRTNGYFLCP